ncbi:MAG: tRNA-binding protein [Candidatus Aenigmatarchaeota archaeon]
MITFDDFQKLDIRVGKIIDIEDAETRKPMFRMKIDFGELGIKQTIAGLKGFYTREDLLNKKVAALVNLEPKKLGSELSECMVLAAVVGNDEKVVVLNPEKDIEAGTKIY